MTTQESDELKKFLKELLIARKNEGLLTNKNFNIDDDIDKIIEGLLRFGKGSYPKIAHEYNMTEITIKRKALKMFAELTAIIQDWKKIKIQQSNFASTLRDYYRSRYYRSRYSLGDICKSNGILISILNNLKQKITQLNPNQKRKIIQNTKTYFIDNPNYRDLIFVEGIFEEKIFNEPENTIINWLSFLMRNTDLERDIIVLFEDTLQTLKQQLNISDEDFQTWIDTPIDIFPISGDENLSTFINPYLTIKIKRSDNQLRQDQEPLYKIEEAHLSSSSCYPPKPEDYKSFNWIIQEYENQQKDQGKSQEYYTAEELKPILTRLIKDCSSVPCQKDKVLVIDFFCEPQLLSTDFDGWKCEFYGDYSKLRELGYQIRVRSLSRLESQYRRTGLLEEWRNKWQQIQDQSNFTLSNHEKTWMNLCFSKPEDLKTAFRQLLLSGIPVAIWSRCHQRYQQHHQEINNLVTRCEGDIGQLPFVIANTRRECLSKDKDPEHLSNHLSLLWEDPNVIPPFAPLTSGHVGQ